MLHNPAWLLITFQILSFKSYAVCKGLVPACRSKNKVAKDINMLESRRSVLLPSHEFASALPKAPFADELPSSSEYACKSDLERSKAG